MRIPTNVPEKHCMPCGKALFPAAPGGSEAAGFPKGVLRLGRFGGRGVFKRDKCEDGASPSGKASVFGTDIPRFESWRPSQHFLAFGLPEIFGLRLDKTLYLDIRRLN